MLSFYTMKKDSNRAAFALRHTLLLMAACLLLLAWPVVAAPSVGGTSLNAWDLGGGDDGDGGIVVNAGGSTLEHIDRDFDFDTGGGGDEGGGDDDDDDDVENRIGNTGFFTTLSDLSNGGPLNHNFDPKLPVDDSTGSSSSDAADPVVYFGLVEKRPDFEYSGGHREFAPAASFTTGQKGLGVGPGLRDKGTRYSPLGEF